MMNWTEIRTLASGAFPTEWNNHVNATVELLLTLTITEDWFPPILRGVVGADNNKTSNKVRPETAMSTKDARITIKRRVEFDWGHKVSVHLVEETVGLASIVIIPESGVLSGEDVVIPAGDVAENVVCSSRFTGPRWTDEEPDLGLEVARRGLEPRVGNERLVVTDPLSEVGVGDLLVGGAVEDGEADCLEIITLSLGLTGPVLPGSIDSSFFLRTVCDSLIGGALTSFKVSS